MPKTALGLVKAIKAGRKSVRVVPPCKAITMVVIRIKTTARKAAPVHKTTTMAVRPCQCMRTMVRDAAVLAARAAKVRVIGTAETACRATIVIAST